MDTDEFPLVLVAETHEIVGIDLCDALREAGYRVAGPISTVADTEAFLERARPDFAVIDPCLKDGDSLGTMRHLRRRGVPFVVHTDDAAGARRFSDAPWLMKPAVPWDVMNALDAMSVARLRCAAFDSQPVSGEPVR